MIKRLALGCLLSVLLCTCKELKKNPNYMRATPDAGACGDCGTRYCEETSQTCIACLEDKHCPDAAASHCDLTDHTCKPCAQSSQCGHIAGKNVCDDQKCVQCTENDMSACKTASGNPAVCNIVQGTCTSRTAHVVRACGACLFDDDCVEDHRCVALSFKGTPRAGGYCLKLASKGCSNPYLVNVTRGSLSHPQPALKYCAINENKTTCEAILQSQAPAPTSICAPSSGTPDDTKCGAPGLNDGLCRNVNSSSDYRCTYECEDVKECSGTDPCNCTGASCVKYCGG